ncbi:MarR family winged helix-turn-helix transcriptional regulator [Streptomyces sp. NPDC020490]|uniref:MarR family winged helix-turn-helix transcriptional regulator n=1 Tax=Streptomyces sp. NPDC020490 TaxID=3365078 RepID=UPI003797351A
MADRDYGLEAWRAMLLAHKAALQAIESDVQRDGRVPLTWYDVLLELKAAGAEGLRMREVADRVVLSRTRVSRLVDDMVRAGLVHKTPDPYDGRVSWAAITEEGAAMLRATAPVYLRSIHRRFSVYLSDEDAQVVAEALRKVAQQDHGVDGD